MSTGVEYCRVCGEAIPAGRRGLFCSRACHRESVEYQYQLKLMAEWDGETRRARELSEEEAGRCPD